MQDSVCCDYFRTPVKYMVVDIFVFVGGTCNLEDADLLQISDNSICILV